jgi:hypothetical protein
MAPGGEMNWEEKLQAIQALGENACLKMRKPGNWYVANTGIEIAANGLLISPTESETTPESAVKALWFQLTEELEPGRYLVANSGKAYRWNGFMWAGVVK